MRPGSFDALLSVARAVAAQPQPNATQPLLNSLDEIATAAPLNRVQLELARAELAIDAGLHATAADHVQQAWSALQIVPRADARWRVRVLLARASSTRALNKPGGLAAAKRDVDAAERLLRAAGHGVSYAMTEVFNERTLLAYAEDNLQSTLHWAQREVDLVRRLDGPDAPAQLHALATLGAVHGTLRDFDAAEKALSQGRRIGQRAPQASRPAYLGILDALSSTLLVMGRPAQALDIAAESLTLATADWGDGSVQTLSPLARRARAEEVLQRFVQARLTHERVLTILQDQGEEINVARRLRIVDEAAAFYLRVNDIDAAQRLVDQSLLLTPAGGSLGYWRGRVLWRAATIAAAESRWAPADALLQQAVPLMSSTIGATNSYLIEPQTLRCEVQLRAGMIADSCDQLARFQSTLRNASPPVRIAARLALGSYAAQAGQSADSLAHLLAALSAAQMPGGAGLRWLALDRVAIHLRGAGQPDQAVLLAKQAVANLQAVRGQFAGTPDLRAGWLADRLSVYRRLADWLAEDQRVDEALQVLRLLKSDEYRSFVQSRADATATDTGECGLFWTATEARWLRQSPLAARPTAASSSHAPASAPRSAPGEAAPALLPDLEQIEKAEAGFTASWRRALQTPLQRDRSSPLKPCNGRPREGELMATLFAGSQHLNVVLRSAKAQRLVRIAGDMAALQRDVGNLLRRMAEREDSLPLLQSLHQRLGMPLVEAEAQRVGARRLALQLDGDLRYLPFAALMDGKVFLVERYAIEQQSVGAHPPRPPAAAQPQGSYVNAFGSTRALGGLPALPAVADEICGIVDGPVEQGENATRSSCAGRATRGAVPGEAWLDDAFTQPALRQAAASGRDGRFDLLHIATHFVLRPGEIGRSWMLLGNGQRLDLNELLSWRLQSQDLITLSACQTDLGGGAELEGLSTLLLERGAGAVLASLWSVDDRGTSLLMQQFYARIKAGADPASALRQVQIGALRGSEKDGGDAAVGSDPSHWAGFVLSSSER